MTRNDLRTLSASLSVAAMAMLVTHPVGVVASFVLSAALGARAGVHRRAPLVPALALALAASVAVLNTLFSWNGDTVLWRAPFRVALLGRPLVTVEAVTWGAMAGLQIGAAVLSFATATLCVAPEALHRAMWRLGLPSTLAVGAGLSLRLLPETARDAAAMRTALRARGVATDGVRGTARTLVPLTARALDRALLVEEALVLRGYDGRAALGRRLAPPPGPVVFALLSVATTAAFAFAGPLRPDYFPAATASLGWWPAVSLALAAALPTWLVAQVRP